MFLSVPLVSETTSTLTAADVLGPVWDTATPDNAAMIPNAAIVVLLMLVMSCPPLIGYP
jgi:hypothetical protein